MGLKWFDYVGHAAVGAMDKDAEIRKEQLDRRFKELDENKTMYRALATTRYTKDLEKFEEETKKHDSLKSVYSSITSNRDDPHTAAMKILNVEYPDFKDLDKELKNQMAKNMAANFERIYEGEGENKKEVGFKVYHDEISIQAPQRGDYFKGPEYWAELSDQIKSKTTGPLQEQLIKLLTGKKLKATVDLGDNEVIKGTEIKEFIKKNDVQQKESYSIMNVSGFGADTKGLIPYLDEDHKLWDYYENTTRPEIKKIIGIEGTSTKEAVVAPLISMDSRLQETFTMDVENNELIIGPDGHFAAQQLNGIWQSVWNKQHDSIYFSNYPNAEGKFLTGDVRKHNLSDGTVIYNELVDSRLLLLSNETWLPFDSKTASAAGFYWIPESIINFDDWLQIGEQDGGREWQKDMVLKMTAAANVAIKGKKGSVKTLQRDYIDPALQAVWREQLDIWKRDEEKKKDEKLMPDSHIRGKAKLVKQEMIEATMQKNDGTWEEAVQYLREIHDYTIPSGLETKPKKVIKKKESKIPKKKKKNEIKKTETETKIITESTGVGDQPWLFADGSFNPNWDASNLNMDEMYTVGTPANLYDKAKRKYETEQRAEADKSTIKNIFGIN